MRGRIADQKSEILALQAMLDATEEASSILASNLREDHFYSVETQDAFKRISVLRKNNRVPQWSNILADVVIPLKYRKRLEALSAPTISMTKAGATEIVDNLESLRCLRTLYEMAKNISDKLTDYDSVDVRKLVEESAGFLGRTSRPNAIDKHNEAYSNRIVRRLVERMREGMRDRFIPTGMEEFDRINGGIPRGSAMTIGAPSGEGKSLMAENIALYIALKGYRVAFISLEMPEEMVWTRALAWLAGVTVNDMMQHKLTRKKYDYVGQCYEVFQRILERLGGCFRVEHPSQTPTMQQLLAQVQPYKYDVIVVDYLTLLDGMSGADFWQRIGDAAKLAQAFAINEDNVVVNVVQTDEEGNARLSQQIKDNAGLMWVWESSKRKKAANAERPDFEKKGIDSFRVLMPKTRMQNAFDMTVFRSKAHMQLATDVSKLQKPLINDAPYAEDTFRQLSAPPPIQDAKDRLKNRVNRLCQRMRERQLVKSEIVDSVFKVQLRGADANS